MSQATNTQALPLWKERFFTPFVVSVQPARANPTRGLAITTQAGGQGQLFAWNPQPGALQ